MQQSEKSKKPVKSILKKTQTQNSITSSESIVEASGIINQRATRSSTRQKSPMKLKQKGTTGNAFDKTATARFIDEDDIQDDDTDDQGEANSKHTGPRTLSDLQFQESDKVGGPGDTGNEGLAQQEEEQEQHEGDDEGDAKHEDQSYVNPEGADGTQVDAEMSDAQSNSIRPQFDGYRPGDVLDVSLSDGKNAKEAIPVDDTEPSVADTIPMVKLENAGKQMPKKRVSPPEFKQEERADVDFYGSDDAESDKENQTPPRSVAVFEMNARDFFGLDDLQGQLAYCFPDLYYTHTDPQHDMELVDYHQGKEDKKNKDDKDSKRDKSQLQPLRPGHVRRRTAHKAPAPVKGPKGLLPAKTCWVYRSLKQDPADYFVWTHVTPVMVVQFAMMGLGNWKGWPANAGKNFLAADLKSATVSITLSAEAWDPNFRDENGQDPRVLAYFESLRQHEYMFAKFYVEQNINPPYIKYVVGEMNEEKIRVLGKDKAQKVIREFWKKPESKEALIKRFIDTYVTGCVRLSKQKADLNKSNFSNSNEQQPQEEEDPEIAGTWASAVAGYQEAADRPTIPHTEHVYFKEKVMRTERKNEFKSSPYIPLHPVLAQAYKNDKLVYQTIFFRSLAAFADMAEREKQNKRKKSASSSSSSSSSNGLAPMDTEDELPTPSSNGDSKGSESDKYVELDIPLSQQSLYGGDLVCLQVECRAFEKSPSQTAGLSTKLQGVYVYQQGTRSSTKDFGKPTWQRKQEFRPIAISGAQPYEQGNRKGFLTFKEEEDNDDVAMIIAQMDAEKQIQLKLQNERDAESASSSSSSSSSSSNARTVPASKSVTGKPRELNAEAKQLLLAQARGHGAGGTKRNATEQPMTDGLNQLPSAKRARTMQTQTQYQQLQQSSRSLPNAGHGSTTKESF